MHAAVFCTQLGHVTSDTQWYMEGNAILGKVHVEVRIAGKLRPKR